MRPTISSAFLFGLPTHRLVPGAWLLLAAFVGLLLAPEATYGQVYIQEEFNNPANIGNWVVANNAPGNTATIQNSRLEFAVSTRPVDSGGVRNEVAAQLDDPARPSNWAGVRMAFTLGLDTFFQNSPPPSASGQLQAILRDSLTNTRLRIRLEARGVNCQTCSPGQPGIWLEVDEVVNNQVELWGSWNLGPALPAQVAVEAEQTPTGWKLKLESPRLNNTQNLRRLFLGAAQGIQLRYEFGSTGAVGQTYPNGLGWVDNLVISQGLALNLNDTLCAGSSLGSMAAPATGVNHRWARCPANPYPPNNLQVDTLPFSGGASGVAYQSVRDLIWLEVDNTRLLFFGAQDSATGEGTVFRYSFGSSWNSLPTRGNFVYNAGKVDAPRALSLVQEDIIWFLFHASTSNGGELRRYNLGTNPTNTPTSDPIRTGLGANPVGLEVLRDQNNWYALWVDSLGGVQRLDLGPNLRNISSTTLTTFPPPPGASFSGTQLVRSDSVRRLVLASAGDSALYRLDFSPTFGGTATWSRIAQDTQQLTAFADLAVEPHCGRQLGLAVNNRGSNPLKFFTSTDTSDFSGLRAWQSPPAYFDTLSSGLEAVAGPILENGRFFAFALNERDNLLLRLSWDACTSPPTVFSSTATPTLQLDTPGVYCLFYTQDSGGPAQDQACGWTTVLPQPILEGDSVLCPGDTQKLVVRGLAGTPFSWNTGHTGDTLQVWKTGAYGVNVAESSCPANPPTIRVRSPLADAVNFGPQRTISTTSDGARAVDAADINGDGYPDLVVACNQSGAIEYFQNLGTGGFAPAQTPFTAAGNATSIHLADLNGSGRPDAVFSHANPGEIRWIENTGGALPGPTFLLASGLNAPSRVFATPLDTSPEVDVLAAVEDADELIVLANQGAGLFAAPQLLSSQVDGPQDVRAQDLDGDGLVDIMSVSQLDNKTAVYPNAGTSWPTQLVVSQAAQSPSDIKAADLNQDGKPDLLVASQNNNTVSWFENQGNGDYAPQQTINNILPGVVDVLAADLDGDGLLDVISASEQNDAVFWQRNLGGGVFGPTTLVTQQADGVRQLAAADLDRDGDLDLVSVSQLDDKVAWYENLSIQLNPDTTADTLCGGNPATLAAVGADATVRWYADSLGGPLLATGDTLVTPPLDTTTTYWFELWDSSCGRLPQPRQPLTALVQPTPHLEADSACLGDPFTVRVVNPIPGQTYNWLLPDGSQLPVVTITFSNARLANSGTYRVRTNGPGCRPKPDTLDVQVRVCDQPPVITASDSTRDSLNACLPDTGVLVAPGLTITDPDGPNLQGASVSLTNGFNPAEDSLSFTPAPGITGNYDPQSGILELRGGASAAVYQQVLRSVRFHSRSGATPTRGWRQVDFVLSNGVYNPGNGHFYRLVTFPGSVDWVTARDSAQRSFLFGQQGYLVTITSAQENAFVQQKINANTWMGASDAAQNRTWRWVTGPEGLEAGGQGRHFSNQVNFNCSNIGTGSSVAGNYQNWDNNEPNDCGTFGSNEDYAHLYANGTWNDFQANNPNVRAFVVEFGGMPDDPSLQIQSSVWLEVKPRPQVQLRSDTTLCQGDSLQLQGAAGGAPAARLSYTWSPTGYTTPNLWVDSAATYVLTVQDTNGCSDRDTFTLGLSPIPSVAIDTPVGCPAAGQLAFTATGASTYIWNGGAFLGNPYVLNAPFADTLRMRVVGAGPSGCSAADSLVYLPRQLPFPDPSVSGNNQACQQDTLGYRVSRPPGVGVQWQVTGGQVLGGLTGDSITVLWDTAGNYSLRATLTDSATGCSKTTPSRSVSVFPRPLPSGFNALTGDTLGCVEDSFRFALPPLGRMEYLWELPSVDFTNATRQQDSIFARWDTAVFQWIGVTIRDTLTGCTFRDSLYIRVRDYANPDIVGPDTVCPFTQAAYTLAAPNRNSTLTWTVTGGAIAAGQGTDTIFVNWAGTNGSVEVAETNPNLCPGASEPQQVQVVPVPDVQIQPSDTVACQNDDNSAQSTVPLPGSLEWRLVGGSFVTPDTLPTVDYTWDSAGTGLLLLRAFYPSIGCFSKTDTVEVQVRGLPQPSILGPDSICQFEQAQYSAVDSGYRFNWSTFNALPTGSTTTDTLSLQGNVVGFATVQLQVTDTVFGCQSPPVVKTLVVNGKPAPYIQGDNQVCAGNQRSYTGGTGQAPWINPPLDWTWRVQGGQILSGQNTTQLDVLWNQPAYLLELIGQDPRTGCADTAELNIAPRPLPAVNFTLQGAPCVDNNGLLVSPQAANVRYTWTIPGSTGVSISPPVGRTHTVQWARPGGTKQVILEAYDTRTRCGQTDTLDIEIFDLPEPDVQGDSVLCGQYLRTYAAPGSNWRYQWLVTNGRILGQDTLAQVDIEWSRPAGTGQIGVRVVDTASGCVGEDRLDVAVYQLPKTEIVGPDFACRNDTQSFRLSSSLVNTLRWDVGGGTQFSPQGLDQLDVRWTSIGTGQIQVEVEFASGCTTQANKFLTISGINAFAGPDETICLGEETTLIANSGRSVNWSPTTGLEDNRAFVTQAAPRFTTDYVLTVTDANFCIDRDTVRISVVQPYDSLETVETQLCQDSLLLRAGIVDSTYLYQWDEGDTTRSDSLWVYEPGVHQVRMWNDCHEQEQTFILRSCQPNFIFPSAFSPNGDGLNDGFRPGLNYPNFTRNYRFIVVGRWGGVLFSSTDPLQNWDGTHNGKAVPEGAYGYYFYAENEVGEVIEKSGMVTVTR